MRLRDLLRPCAVAVLGLLLGGVDPAAAAKRPEPGQRAAASRAAAPAAALARPSGSHQASRTAQGQARSRAGQGQRESRRASQRVERAAPLRGRLATTPRDSRAAYASDGCARPGKCRSVQFSIAGWTQGLPPAANIQAQDCPDGTMATLARGHDNIVRCMPL